MRLYHATVDWSEVQQIQQRGFVDRDDCFFVPPIAGVHLVDQLALLADLCPLTVEVAASERELVAYELVEAGKPYREWFVPAALLNRHAVILTHGDAQAAGAACARSRAS